MDEVCLEFMWENGMMPWSRTSSEVCLVVDLCSLCHGTDQAMVGAFVQSEPLGSVNLMILISILSSWVLQVFGPAGPPAETPFWMQQSSPLYDRKYDMNYRPTRRIVSTSLCAWCRHYPSYLLHQSRNWTIYLIREKIIWSSRLSRWSGYTGT
jgi:hypothetical protein